MTTKYNYDTIIFIQTYNRPHLLLNVLKDLYRETNGSSDYLLWVVNDASPNSDYLYVQKYIESNFVEFIYTYNEQNYGKFFYHKSLNAHYGELKKYTFNYYIHLPDDILLVPKFIKRAKYNWNNIADPKKISLNLLLDAPREHTSCWTDMVAELTTFDNEFKVYHSGWMDMMFITDIRFFRAINYNISLTVAEQNIRQASNPHLSSGVGAWISTKLHPKYNLYKVVDSLGKSIPCNRQMNYETNEIKHDSIFITNHSNISHQVYLINTPEEIKLFNNVDYIFLYLNISPKLISDDIVFNNKVRIFEFSENIGKITPDNKFLNDIRW